MYEINILKSEKCYEDVLIEIEVKNNTIKAFLTKENIIRSDSRVKECNLINESFLTPSLNSTIIRKGNNIKINKVENLVEVHLANLIYNEQQLHFQHHEQIIKGFDFIAEEFSKNNEYNDVSNGYYILPDDKVTTNNDFITDLVEAKNFVISIISSLKDKIKAIISTIIIVLIIIGVVSIFFIAKSIQKKIKTKQCSAKVNSMVEEMNKMEKALGQRLQERGEDDI